MLFACTWSILPGMRTDTATFVASTDLDFLQRESFGEDCKFVGRWHNVANLTGVMVFEAKDSEAAAKHAWNWSEECGDMEIAPVVTDEEAREIIMKRKPDYITPKENLNAPLEEGESLFLVSWKLYPEKKAAATKNWAMMTKEEEIASFGNCRLLGRFHNLPEGTGFFLGAAKSAFDIQQVLYSWMDTGTMKVSPVVTDVQAQHVFQSKEGYHIKSDTLKKRMEDLKV